MVEKRSEAGIADELISHVSNGEIGDAARSRASQVSSPSEEDADLIPLCAHIQELQAVHENLLARRAGNEKIPMDTMQKLCSDKIKSCGPKSHADRLAQNLTEIRVAQERSTIDRQTTVNAVSTKEVAEKRFVALMGELQGVRITYAQKLHVREAEANALKLQLHTARIRADEPDMRGTEPNRAYIIC